MERRGLKNMDEKEGAKKGQGRRLKSFFSGVFCSKSEALLSRLFFDVLFSGGEGHRKTRKEIPT
jgi:hypothetical protein